MGEVEGSSLDEDITELLVLAKKGDRAAEERFYHLVYKQLHRLAKSALRRERAGHTLQTTEIIHEAYVRLTRSPLGFNDRMHFFRVAAHTMRRILVDYARKHRAQKRGTGVPAVNLENVCIPIDEQVEQVMELDDALHRLERQDPRVCKVVELRFFAGLSIDETASALGIASRTVKRDWEFAKSWLYAELQRR